MTGAKLPGDPELDGESLLPLFTGGDDSAFSERSLFWHFPAYLQSYGGKDDCLEQRDPLFRSRPCSIVRKGKWKLHQYFEDGGLELYNLDSDIGESKNLAESNPEKAEELLSVLQSWREKVNAPVPTERNPDFDPEKEAAAIAKLIGKK